MFPPGKSEVDNRRRSTLVNASSRPPRPSPMVLTAVKRRYGKISRTEAPGGGGPPSCRRFTGMWAQPPARRLMSAGRLSGGPLGRGLDHGMWGAFRGFWTATGGLPAWVWVMGRGGCLSGTSLGRGFHGGDRFGTRDGGHVGCTCLAADRRGAQSLTVAWSDCQKSPRWIFPVGISALVVGSG